MSRWVLCILFLFTVYSELVCQNNQVYVKVLKNSKSYASEESYEIWNGETKLVTSPSLPDNALHTAEFCLPQSTNSQYTITLMDSYGDSWSAGAYVQIQALYGNTVFKNWMHSSRSESYSFSLYYAFMRNEQWKLASGTVTGSWTEASFDDSQWSNEYLGFVVGSVSGTQYYRKTFNGVLNMAAYEMSMNYRFGIIVYLNGAEIYRDNMPEGPATSETAPSSQYPSIGFHTIFRPGHEILASNTIAVEIHFSNGQTYSDFDTYMSLLAPSLSDSTCYLYNAPIEVTSTGDVSIEGNAVDFTKNTAASISGVPSSLVYSFSSDRAFVNGLGIWPNTDSTNAPHTFLFQGANGADAEEWTTLLDVSNSAHENQVMKVLRSFSAVDYFSHYRVMFNTLTSDTIKAYEMHPLICNVPMPTTIEFSETTYNRYALYETINIRPVLRELANCQITPAPANGLTFDSENCILSGVSSASGSFTFTMSTTLSGIPLSGSFSINFQGCNGSFVKILRTYKDYPSNEGFNIIDRTTQQSVLTVALNTVIEGNTDWSAYLCLTNSKYEIETFVSENNWYQQSYLYVRGIFDTESYETIIRVNRDDQISMPIDTIVNVQYAIPARSNWYYKMGEVPANWHNSQTAGWTEKPASGYPASTNQIQLYKKTFNVASINEVAGLVLSLKYQYGVLVYLNGHEVFRKGILGDLSVYTMAITALESVKYRQISLPLSGSYKGGAFTNFVQTGSNTVAIALVASSATITASTFDCALRLMGSDTVIRNFDYSVSSAYNLLGEPNNIFDLSSHYDTYSNRCNEERYIDITFNDDRHEWLSSISIQGQQAQNRNYPKGFDLMGRNNADEEWVLVKHFSGLTWSEKNQRNRYWTLSTEAFNQYRFTNFVAEDETTLCVWQIGSIQLLRDSFAVEVPALSYPTSTIFKDIEMAEIYPNSDYYTDFSSTPALPTGVLLDSITGMISGTAAAVMPATTYTITAKRYNGESTSTTLILDCVICTGGKSLITLMVHTDTYPEEMYFKLFSGKGTSGTLVKSIDRMKNRNANQYFDYCLPDGIYTYQFFDKHSDGWTSPAGYYLSVDVGALKFAVGHVYGSAVSSIPPTISFSSYLPFQVEYSDWKVLKSSTISEDWTSINFDDASWSVMKAADIGTNEAITTYIRKEVMIDDISNYNVFNVRVKYIGGVVAYFNGRKVARFNLDEYFTSSSESIAVYEAAIYSKFHIILATAGAVTGKNMIAFEVHRGNGQSSSIPVVFDATGIFDVNDCSFAVDTYSQITGTAPSSDSNSIFFDFFPQTKASLPNEVGTYTEWTVENLEGSVFNALGVETFTSVTGWAFSLYGRTKTEDTYGSLFAETELSTTERSRNTFSVPVAVAGFRQFKLEYDYAASEALQLSEYVTLYCKATGEGVCPGIDEYPSVGEGQISPGTCPEGYRGYSYRTCSNGSLGEVQTDKCIHKIPADLHYNNDRLTLVIGTNVKSEAPTYRNIITKFSLGPNVNLPKGLQLDATTGIISGIPQEEVSLAVFTIYGENSQGTTEVAVTFTIRLGECKAEGQFGRTLVGGESVFECSTVGSFVGTMVRKCSLGEKDGEWSKVTGSCIPIFLVVIGIVILLVLIAIMIFVILRVTCKAKATGGTKGKKKTLAKQKQPQETKKEVKV